MALLLLQVMAPRSAAASLQAEFAGCEATRSLECPVGKQPVGRLLVNCDRHLGNTLPLRSSP
jgi:hypothetical protein